jgi:linoleoyl-CoA desaturase
VMHDGNHGSYSTKSWVNKFMGGTILCTSRNVYNWQVQLCYTPILIYLVMMKI